MKFVHAFFWAVLGCCAAARGQTAALTANAATYSAAGGQVVLTATLGYASTRDTIGAITVTNAGAGYTSAPMVVLSGGGGTGASATVVTLNAGGVKDVRVETGGSGYTSAPTVGFSGGGGSGAAAVAQLATMNALGFTIALPAGWTLLSVGGPNVPGISPPEGAAGVLEFSYTSVPANGASFTVTVRYPANLTGAQTITGTAVFRPPPTEITVAPITLAPAGAAPSAPGIATQPASVAVVAGQPATFTVAATGTAPLSYQWRKDGISLPGATTATLSLTNVSLAAAGSYSVVVANAAGSVTSASATLAVTPVSPVLAPQITAQPVARSATVGGSATFSVSATGTAPLGYQWRKDGVNLAGATAASLALTNLTSEMAGGYSVVVTNAAGAVTSAAALLTIQPATSGTAPQIISHPASASVTAGGNVTFSVGATGTAPLAYQWHKDDAPLAGATGSTLALGAVAPASAGRYTVVVSNAAGSVVSAAAVLTVVPAQPAGPRAYFGGMGGAEGAFALLVRADGSAAFLASAASVCLLARTVRVNADGRFEFTAVALNDPASRAGLAAGGAEYSIRGSIAGDAVAGSISGLNATFSGEAAAVGATRDFAGFYQAGVAGKSSAGYAIAGAAGDVFIVAVLEAVGEAGRGRLDATGALQVQTDEGARISGAIATDGRIAFTRVPASGATVSFAGGDPAVRGNPEKLVNLSTRSRVGPAAGGLITGFVVTGNTSKLVLVRAVGPTLASFGVVGPLAGAHLEVFKGALQMAAGDDWGRGADAVAVAAAAARVGAFALPDNSRDAALLLTLTPGDYTAVVTGQAGTSGVSLVEVYDATEPTAGAASAQRIVNLSTRATTGAADDVLIAGFVIAGAVPKRVLVRGIGPGLARFDVAGALARPRVGVFSGDTLLAENAGWSGSPEASLVARAADEVGAFALATNAADAALVIYLAPGAYTAQVSGAGGTTGMALVEIYELP